MKQLIGIMADHCQADDIVTYFLISAVGENIQYQHNSSSSISIFLGNTSHFIPIQYFPFQILSSRSISTFFHRSGLAKVTTHYSGNQVEIHTMVEKPKLSKFQTVQYRFDKRYGHFCTSSSKTLKCITQWSPHQRKVKL